MKYFYDFLNMSIIVNYKIKDNLRVIVCILYGLR